MKYRKFGTSLINVSEIALGTMHFKWIISEGMALNLLDYYSEAGGNIIDTSDMYTQWGEGLHGGEAETIMGKWFSLKKNREKIFLTTKVRARMWEGADGEGLSKSHIVKACEASLKRLQTDYIDLYMSHWPDENTQAEETLLAYEMLIKQGKVRFIGCSNYSGSELKKALKVGERFAQNYMCVEPYYNLINRTPFENEVLPLVKKYKLAVTPYSPLAGGFLTSIYKNTKTLPSTMRAKFSKNKITENNLILLRNLQELGEKYGKTISQIALAWLLSHSWMTAPIIGPETVEQLKENLGAVDFSLLKEDVKLINTLSDSN